MVVISSWSVSRKTANNACGIMGIVKSYMGGGGDIGTQYGRGGGGGISLPALLGHLCGLDML